jgi:hypothetical protein
MPFTEAIQHVQSRRCCIHISEALHNQLREFETIYQNRGVSLAISHPPTPGAIGRGRRVSLTLLLLSVLHQVYAVLVLHLFIPRRRGRERAAPMGTEVSPWLHGLLGSRILR